jgi:hypothetical protein
MAGSMTHFAISERGRLGEYNNDISSDVEEKRRKWTVISSLLQYVMYIQTECWI